jgi:hypothetical protein
MRLFLVALVGALTLFRRTQSTEQKFEDVLLGTMHPSRNKFPFLVPTTLSSVQPLVFPNSQQMHSLVSDALEGQNNMGGHFKRFETFRRFLGDFLSDSYRQNAPLDIPDGVLLQQQSFSFASFMYVTVHT